MSIFWFSLLFLLKTISHELTIFVILSLVVVFFVCLFGIQHFKLDPKHLEVITRDFFIDFYRFHSSS